MRALFVLALVALLAGCAQPAVTPAAVAPAPVVDVREAIVAPTFVTPIDLGPILGGAEPSVAVAQDGTIYVVTPIELWRSDDGGLTYARLGKLACPSGLPACPGLEQYETGLVGSGDASLAVTKDGTVHWAGLGTGIPYQRSTDKGETWSKEMDVSDGTGSDREWAVVDAQDRLFIQWRGADDSGKSGIFIRSSDDAGLTWGNITRVSDDGRQGPVSADPTGDSLILAHQLPNELYVARSEDRGATWSDVKVRDINGRPYIFPISAFDANGTGYLVWSEDPTAPQAAAPIVEPSRIIGIPSVFLSVSHDKGLTWSEPAMLSTPGVPALFPWIAAGKAGRVAIAWYEGQQPTPANRLPNMFDVKLAMSTTADMDAPEWVVAQVNGAPVHVGSFCTEGSACSLTGGDRSMLDFFEVRLTPEGKPVLAWTADDTVKMQRTKVFASVMETGTLLL